jgi:general nucleoside transport system permease protein
MTSWPFRLEPRSAPAPASLRLLATAGAIVVALGLGGLFFAASGHDPVRLYMLMARGAFGDAYGVSEVFVKAIPLALAGLGVAVAFRAGLWNIGAEGQIYFGAIGATAVVLVLPHLPTPLMLPLMVMAGALTGGLWALLVAIPRVYRNVSEIITSLMFNYVAILFSDYLIYGPWKDPKAFGFPLTPLFPKAAQLPSYFGTRVHFGLVMALVAAALLHLLLRRTPWGFELRVLGDSTGAARYLGLNIGRHILLAMFLSGALAGLAGMTEVSGILHRLQRDISPGYGYAAIIVAWLGRLSPWGVLVTALLLGALFVGGYSLQAAGLAASSVFMLQGGMLFAVLVAEVLLEYRVVRRAGRA